MKGIFMSLEFLKNYSCIVDYMSVKILNAAHQNPTQSNQLQDIAVSLKKIAYDIDQISKKKKKLRSEPTIETKH